MLKISDLISKGLFKIISPINTNKIILPESSFSPFITISRESGSGGAPIAKMVAGSLGFELYDEKYKDTKGSSIFDKLKVVSGGPSASLVEKIDKTIGTKKEKLAPVDKSVYSLFK